MKGHIRERSPGHWAIVIDIRDPQSNQRKRHWHSFVGTKRQAQVECARLLTETKNGTSVDPTRMTVAAFLERWIEHMESQVSPRSHERYAELCRKNLAPLLGGLALTKLQPAQKFQSAHQRPPGRAVRPFCANCNSHAPRPAGSPPAGRAVATPLPQSRRCRQAAQGGAAA